jgi:hypothetical protein
LQNCECCRLGLIEHVHGRNWKVQITVPLYRLKHNSTFKHENGYILNLETSAIYITHRKSFNQITQKQQLGFLVTFIVLSVGQKCKRAVLDNPFAFYSRKQFAKLTCDLKKSKYEYLHIMK